MKRAKRFKQLENENKKVDGYRANGRCVALEIQGHRVHFEPCGRKLPCPLHGAGAWKR